MGRHVRPQRVLQTTQKFFRAGMLPGHQLPVWYGVVEAIPPSEILTRTPAVQHREPSPRLRTPRNVFRPQQIVYEEDELRRTFYRDHPWELARPRIVLETDGDDDRHRDWSRGIRQPGMALCGEW
jgi:small subunit ribosomal protein S23